MHALETALIEGIQSIASPFWDKLFIAVSELGAVGFAVLICLLCYYCFDKELGRKLIYTVLLSLSLNGIAKDLFRVRRPVGTARIPEASRIGADYTPDGYQYSYSMPSNHSQTAAATWSALGFYYKRFSVWIAGAVAVLVIGFSRIYLGVHYPSDVLVGIALGFAVAGLAAFASHYFWDANLFYLFVCAIMLLSFLLNAPSADTIKSVAALCGFTAASIIDDKYINYKVAGTDRVKYLTLAGAVLVAAGIYFVSGQFLPENPYFDFFKYFIIVFSLAGIYPAAVMWLRRR